jgi:hypothetical protein
MRHILLPGAPAASPRRMVQSTTKARLIAPAGSALGLLSRLSGTAARTVDLAAVAAAADEHLRPAPGTQEQPARRLLDSRRVRGWTVAATGGILPRHACSARCGARRRIPDLAV